MPLSATYGWSCRAGPRPRSCACRSSVCTRSSAPPGPLSARVDVVEERVLERPPARVGRAARRGAPPGRPARDPARRRPAAAAVAGEREAQRRGPGGAGSSSRDVHADTLRGRRRGVKCTSSSGSRATRLEVHRLPHAARLAVALLAFELERVRRVVHAERTALRLARPGPRERRQLELERRVAALVLAELGSRRASAVVLQSEAPTTRKTRWPSPASPSGTRIVRAYQAMSACRGRRRASSPRGTARGSRVPRAGPHLASPRAPPRCAGRSGTATRRSGSPTPRARSRGAGARGAVPTRPVHGRRRGLERREGRGCERSCQWRRRRAAVPPGSRDSPAVPWGANVPAFARVRETPRGKSWPLYSYRSAWTGSTCEARRAGTYPAPRATSSNTTSEMARTTGSCPWSP